MAQNIPPNLESLLAMFKDYSYGKGMREVKPEERASFGISPKDPNKYSVGPNGKLIGTMIGWTEQPQDLSKLLAGFRGLPGKPLNDPSSAPPMQNLPGKIPGVDSADIGSTIAESYAGSPASSSPSRPDTMIPRANKNGLRRVSPGVYRNKDGGLVRKVKG